MNHAGEHMNRPPTDRTQARSGSVAERCMSDEALQRFADERDPLEPGERARMDDHIEGCTACSARLHHVRRFRTLLLRTRVTGLGHEQWRALDERMALMGSEPPPRAISVGARAYWGVTIAAGLAALAVGGWTFVSERIEAGQAEAVADQVVAARTLAELTPLAVRGQVAGLLAHGGDGHWVALDEGAPVVTGMMIRSGANDAVMELSAEGGAHVATLTVRAETEVAVDAATARDVFVRVRSGEVDLAVDHRRVDQRFAVLAGGFRVQVVGTRFSVRHGADASVDVIVREGAVRVDAADVATAPTAETLTVVRAGQRWQARGGRISFGPIEGIQSGAEPVLPVGTEGAAATPSNTPAPAEPADGDAQAESPRTSGQVAARARSRSTLPGPPPVPDLSAQLGPVAPRPAIGVATPAPRADVKTPRRFVIEVPPQHMSPEEVERARASERGALPSRPRPELPTR